MLRIALIAGLILLTSVVRSQENQITQDPQAGQILDHVALKAKSMKSMQTDFELVIEDKKEKSKKSSTGVLVMKQDKYKITSEGSTVYFNGKTMWTYQPAGNEVTITEPVAQPDDLMSNPSVFFTSYKNDFKYRYVRETTVNGSRCHEIDLFPKNLNQPYSRIKIFIGVKSDLPDMISSIGKDGVDYTIYLKNPVFDHEIPDAAFSFDPTKFKKVEIIDMRGIK